MTQNRESTSQETPRFDPFEFYRQFYEANEQAWTKAVKDVTTTHDYAEVQGKVLESMLAFQKIMRDSVNAQMNSLNIPTRDDVSRLGEIMVAAEEKVDRLVDRLDDLEDRIASLEKSLEQKLAGIEGRLPGLESHLGDLNKKLVDKLDQLDKRLADRMDQQDKRLDDSLDQLEKRLARIPDRVVARMPEGGEQAGQEKAAAETPAPRAAGSPRPGRKASQPAPAAKNE